MWWTSSRTHTPVGAEQSQYGRSNTHPGGVPFEVVMLVRFDSMPLGTRKYRLPNHGCEVAA